MNLKVCDEEILTVKDVSVFLKICRVNAYALFNRNDFPCIYIGKSKRVKMCDLLDYIENNLKNNN
ncbi:helix-turn-helix domain-containing protein [Clostridium guangxiense]|uniref:helix-turn-helix domain-containing protein n=1 Tax=Clostridium guangxiense TaxID=1662055 RepID=UPI001E598E57|nr:helix-turn-helix domain-containing protein [Clostridium guangxiense]MCD2346863.1 helix-turn-helix domain-containing protein [Clostridium guangxiense]